MHASLEEMDRWMSSYRECLAEPPQAASQRLPTQEPHLTRDRPGLEPCTEGLPTQLPESPLKDITAQEPGPICGRPGRAAPTPVPLGREPDLRCEARVPQTPGQGLGPYGTQEPGLNPSAPAQVCDVAHSSVPQPADPGKQGVTGCDNVAVTAADRLLALALARCSLQGAQALALGEAEAEEAEEEAGPAPAPVRKGNVWLYGSMRTSPGLAGMIHSARLEPEGARLRWVCLSCRNSFLRIPTCSHVLPCRFLFFGQRG